MKDSADIRKVNLNKIRKVLKSGEWKTKQEIALDTGLSVATTNTLLNHLASDNEVISEKIRLHEVGPTALKYKFNKNYETILCITVDKIASKQTLHMYVLSLTGEILEHTTHLYDSITPSTLQINVEKILKKYSNLASILVGIPGISRNGIIEHCDIDSLNNFTLVETFTTTFHLPTYMENDMYFKALGYYYQHTKDEDILTLANFPIGVLPGTVTVHKGTIIKGYHQFAGMVGFLPHEIDYTSLTPETCKDPISKVITSIIVLQDPSTIVLTGSLASNSLIPQITEACLQYIPKEYMPTLLYEEDTQEYYIQGMYQQYLEKKGLL